MTRKFILCLILIFATCPAWSQTLGLRSPKIRLNQIDTDTVRIIYAEGQESKAQRVANLVHYMARKHPVVGSDKLRKISILLQNETDIPNGYVGLAPWVSELYISPPVGNFRLGSLPWTDLLSIHEFRHVQQRSAARTGLSEFAYYLFGEEFFSGLVNVSWPNWYTEGDAVISETALSNQGRGRLPAFLNGYREKVLGETEWSYHKARNGSLKDFVPNHYNLGFLMQNYGRAKFGQDFWDNVALESAAFKGLIYPFSKAVKRVSGESTMEFYKSALQYYRELWNVGPAENELPADPVIEVDHKRFEDHSYPLFDENGNLYVVVESFDQIAKLYRYDPHSMSRRHITNPGYTDESVISVASGKVCWAEYRQDSRWERKDFSTIVVYDEQRNQKRRLTKKHSYFSPALSRDGKKIVALSDDDFQNYELQILNASTGEVLSRLANPQNYYYSFPSWTQDQSAIISAVRDTTGQMAIAIQSMDDDEAEIITQWSFHPIGRPTTFEEWIYFTKSENTVDQLYRVNRKSGNVQKVADSRHSRYQPVINPINGDLFFSEFTNEGRRLMKIGSESISPMDVSTVQSEPEHLAIEPGEGDILSNIPRKKYAAKKYSAFAHPVNIHSWRPVFDDPVLGFELRSLNVLQSIRWNVGFQWNSNDDSYGPYTELALGMWYPEILLGYTGWKNKYTRPSDKHVFEWYENIMNAGVRIPFKGLHGPFNYMGSITSRINRLTAAGNIPESDAFNFLSHQFNFIHRLKRAQKHPMTRFGQAIEITLPHSIQADTASQFQVQTDFTLPSLRNHVIWLQFDYRRELASNTRRFGDFFQYSRGYDVNRNDEAYKTMNWVYRIGINYQLPIVYPDFGFGGVAYFTRVRTNLFADISQVGLETGSIPMNSIGVELLFDIRVLNVEPFSFGLRWALRLQADPTNPNDPSRSSFGVFVPVNRI